MVMPLVFNRRNKSVVQVRFFYDFILPVLYSVGECSQGNYIKHKKNQENTHARRKRIAKMAN